MRQFFLGQRIDVSKDVELLVRSEDQVYAVNIRNLLGPELGKAARDDDESLRIGPQRLADGLTAFAVCLISNGAGVQHNHIGGRTERDDIVGLLAELPGHGTGFGEVEFAAQRMEGDSCHAEKGDFERYSAAVQRDWYFRGFTHDRAVAWLH